MRISKLNKMLNLWEKNELITSDQNKNILEFMKERQKEQFFRFIKWFFILGAFWLLFGAIASVVQFFDLSFMVHIKEFIINVIAAITDPLIKFLHNIFGHNLGYFLGGFACYAFSILALYFSGKLKSDSIIEKLNLTDSQKLILKGNLWLEIVGCILLSAGFMLFNHLLIPDNMNYYEATFKIFPVWHLLGAITFITLAYRLSKVSYLLFGLYFVTLTVGMLSGYGYACYWIGASRPVVQALVGFILILIGYITDMNAPEDDEIKQRFAQTYTWVGLLIGFIALWIMSFWGFDFSYNSHHIATTGELWASNILFIVACLGAMYYGAKFEQKIFFNYGLTFIIIETFTLFCSRLWDKLPYAVASLAFGLLLIGTGKLLVNIYLKKQDKTNGASD